MTVHRTRGVDSARRALQILLQFSAKRPELTIDHLLETHDISQPSAYRYLSLLREMNLIEERSKGVFVLSPQVLKLARAAEVTMDYRAEAQLLLERVSKRTGETALYLRRVNDAAVCLAIAESEHPISISFQPGLLMPLHGGAAAKVLLAEYDKRSQYLAAVRPPLSADARSELEKDLDRIRAEGFAESRGEVDEGVWAVAAPVRAHGVLVGAMTVVAPTYRLEEEHKVEIADELRACVDEFVKIISNR